MILRKTPEEVEELIEVIAKRAVESGVHKALKDLGLHDEQAKRDIREVRDLLDAWRNTKRTAWQTLIRWVTTGILGLMAAFIALSIYQK